MKTNQAEDDERIAKDGEVVRVPMIFMQDSSAPLTAAASQITDGVQHRPGFATISDADRNSRQAIYDGYQTRLVSAYKDPPSVLATDKPPTKVAAKSGFYQTYDSTISERWRGA